MGHDLRLRQCICPLTTCAASQGIYSCHLTPFVILLSAFFLLLWVLAAGAYVYISHSIANIDTEVKSKEPALARNFFFNRLFGDGSEEHTEIHLSPSERR